MSTTRSTRAHGRSAQGVRAVERALGIDNLYDQVSNPGPSTQAAIWAKELYKRDGTISSTATAPWSRRVHRPDDGGSRWSAAFTRRWRQEEVAIKEENQTLATITLQNYYRLYDRLAGMTGTAETEASEFVSTYGLHVVPIPTHKPIARVDQGDLIYKTEDAKFRHADDIIERNAAGQPVLVGTVSVEKSEKLA